MNMTRAEKARRYAKRELRYPALLQELRQSMGWSRGQFAAQVGVAESTILRVERGTMPPPQAVLNAYGEIAEARRQ